MAEETEQGGQEPNLELPSLLGFGRKKKRRDQPAPEPSATDAAPVDTPEVIEPPEADSPLAADPVAEPAGEPRVESAAEPRGGLAPAAEKPKRRPPVPPPGARSSAPTRVPPPPPPPAPAAEVPEPAAPEVVAPAVEPPAVQPPAVQPAAETVRAPEPTVVPAPEPAPEPVALQPPAPAAEEPSQPLFADEAAEETQPPRETATGKTAVLSASPFSREAAGGHGPGPQVQETPEVVEAPGVMEAPTTEGGATAVPRKGSSLSMPAINPRIAAFVTGAVVGLIGVLLAVVAGRGCETVRGVGSCGGIGLFALLVILAIEVLLGAALLRAWKVYDPMSTSFLGVGLVAVFVLLFLLSTLDSVWMLLVIPVLSGFSFTLSWWVTTAFVEDVSGT